MDRNAYYYYNKLTQPAIVGGGGAGMIPPTTNMVIGASPPATPTVPLVPTMNEMGTGVGAQPYQTNLAGGPTTNYEASMRSTATAPPSSNFMNNWASSFTHLPWLCYGEGWSYKVLYYYLISQVLQLLLSTWHARALRDSILVYQIGLLSYSSHLCFVLFSYSLAWCCRFQSVDQNKTGQITANEIAAGWCQSYTCANVVALGPLHQEGSDLSSDTHKSLISTSLGVC